MRVVRLPDFNPIVREKMLTGLLNVVPAMTGGGVGVGSMSNMGLGTMGGMGMGASGMAGMTTMGVGCASTCERRPHARAHHPDQVYFLTELRY